MFTEYNIQYIDHQIHVNTDSSTVFFNEYYNSTTAQNYGLGRDLLQMIVMTHGLIHSSSNAII
jgi:hypothetical protein